MRTLVGILFAAVLVTGAIALWPSGAPEVTTATSDLSAQQPDSRRAPASIAETVAEPPLSQRVAAERRRDVDLLAAGENPLEKLKAAWAQNPDGAVREQVLVNVARLGTGEAARWLAAIAGSDVKLGARAGAALGTIAAPAAARDLLELARGGGPVIVRANAVRALSTSGSASEVAPLTALVEDARQPQRVRQEAALALARIGDGSAVEGLGRALAVLGHRQGADAEQLRLSIIQALGGIGTEPARAALSEHGRKTLSPLERAYLDRELARARRPQAPIK